MTHFERLWSVGIKVEQGLEKLAKNGEVARLVLRSGGAERPEEVAEIATAGGLRVELSGGLLDVIE